MSKDKIRYAYMDGVDWQHELGKAMGGNTLYPGLSDLMDNQHCVKTCGAVKVKVELVEWVEKQKNMTQDDSSEGRLRDYTKHLWEKRDHLLKQLGYNEEQLSKTRAELREKVTARRKLDKLKD